MAEAAEKTVDPKDLSPRDKRELVKDLINQGGATQESLMEALGLEKKVGLSRIFTQLRHGDWYPVLLADDTYQLLNHEEHMEWQAKRKVDEPTDKTKAARTPKVNLDNLQAKRQRAINSVINANKAMENARIKYLKTPDNREICLTYEIAAKKYELADLRYGKFQDTTVAALKLANREALASIIDLDAHVESLRENGEIPVKA